MGANGMDRAAKAHAAAEAERRRVEAMNTPEMRRLHAQIEEAYERIPVLLAEAESLITSILPKLEARNYTVTVDECIRYPEVLKVYEAQHGFARLLGGKGPVLVERGGIKIREDKIPRTNDSGATEYLPRAVHLLSNGRIADDRYSYTIDEYLARGAGPTRDPIKGSGLLQRLVNDLKKLDSAFL